MSAIHRALLVNVAVLLGLDLEAGRGAPWLAIGINALIFFSLTNSLMS